MIDDKIELTGRIVKTIYILPTLQYDKWWGRHCLNVGFLMFYGSLSWGVSDRDKHIAETIAAWVQEANDKNEERDRLMNAPLDEFAEWIRKEDERRAKPENRPAI